MNNFDPIVNSPLVDPGAVVEPGKSYRAAAKPYDYIGGKSPLSPEQFASAVCECCGVGLMLSGGRFWLTVNYHGEVVTREIELVEDGYEKVPE